MSSKLFDLSGRTALITGSTRGLGNALAQGLAEAGAAIVMNGRHAAQLSEWQQVIDTNLTSAFLVGREAARRMIKRGRGGKIINIASLTSEAARATTGPYTTAKGGIKLLTRVMTAEWAELGIQVNALGPGYIVTEMNKALTESPSFDVWVKQRTPARRWGVPADLIGTAVYLASAASDFVNGQIIFVDGGIMAVL